MTAFSDETLMAFADDELDDATRAAVGAAMREDPEIERRIARHRALRVRIRSAYAAELEDTPPERLLAAVRGRGVKTSPVSYLSDARGAGVLPKATARPRWRPRASLAASLLVGIAVGYFALHRPDGLLANSDTGWVASGALAKALTGQLGGERSSTAAVQIGLSFLAKSGDYCRVFSLTGTAAAAGLACRQPGGWKIHVLAQPEDDEPGQHSSGNYRTASSALSPALLDAVQRQMAGEPLNEDAELKARQQGWRAVAH